MPKTADYHFDAVVLDRDDQLIAGIEVQAKPEADWAGFLSVLTTSPPAVSYVFAVDLRYIRIYACGPDSVAQPLVSLDTQQILQHYDQEFANKRVFQPYLLTLVEAWLRDLAYHWKSDSPPGQSELYNSGVLERFKGGTTQRRGD